MGIGPDISEVINELGTRVHVIKHDGSDPIVEYLDYEVSVQASSPFLTQFMLDCTLIYNTQAKAGDIIKFLDDGQQHILAAANKTRFNNAVVTVEGILYRCNVTGDIKYRVTDRDPNTYRMNVGWSGEVENEPALLTGMIDNYEITKQVYGQFVEDQLNLHVSGDVAIKVGHRFELDNGEKYEVLAVEPRRLNNVKICRVKTDTRE